MKRLGLLAAALLLTSGAWGQTDLMGKDAPNFSVSDVVNPTDTKSLEDCRGEVVLIKFWGIN